MLPEGAWYRPPLEPFLTVLHADRDVLVVNKPPGLLSVPGRGPELTDSVLTRVRRDHPGAFDVHRLDLDTSGLLVVALRRAAERELKRQFRDREVEKRYIALVAGRPLADSGVIDLPLAPHPTLATRHVVVAENGNVAEHGKSAHTGWRVLRVTPTGTLLELHPTTGRSHQLRVHLLAIGHPILGDRFYAPPEVLAAAPRLCLHASFLQFRHPYSGESLHFECPAEF